MANLDEVEDVLGDLAKFDFGADLEKEASKIAKKGPHPPVFNAEGLRECTPGWTEIKLKIQCLDNSIHDLTVTEDWTVRDCVKVFAARLTLNWQLFHMQEYIPNRTPQARWLPMDASFQQLKVAQYTKLIFRMRWFKLPTDFEKQPQLLRQLYYHLRDTFITENAPMEKRQAGKLAALHLQVSQGDYDPAKHKPGVISNMLSDIVNDSTIKDSAPDKLEQRILLLYPKFKGKTVADAMLEYIKYAHEVPTFGATMFDMAGLGHAARRVAVLDDGIAVYFGRVDDFTYITYKEISDIALSPDEPNQVIIEYINTGDPRKQKDTVKLTGPQAENLLTTACGYYHLLNGTIPVPDTLPKPIDLPPIPAFTVRPLRQDIFRFRTRLDFFKHTFQHQFKVAKKTIHGKISAQITAALDKDVCLEMLDASSCDLDEKAMQLLATSFDLTFKLRTKMPIKENIMLTSIDFSNNLLKDNSTSINALKTILACPMPIKTVLLRKIDVKSAGSQLADAIHSGKSVDTINLAMNPALAANPSDLLRTLGKMRLSSFCFCNSGLKGVNDLKEFIRSTSDSLTSLNIANAEIDADGIVVLKDSLVACKKLVELDLGECQLGPKGGLTLLEAMEDMPALQRLRLSDNKLGDKFCERFIKMLLGPKHPPLVFIDLALNGLSGDAASALLKSLKDQNNPLEEIVLTSNIIKSNLSKILTSIVAESKKIKRLALRSCELNKSSISALCEVIQKSSTFKKLDVAFNPIPSKVVLKLADAIVATQGLETLNIAQCGISGKELLKLLDALGHNKTLKNIRLDGNKINPSALAKLLESLGTNKTITSIGLCEIDASQKEIIEFLSKIPTTTDRKSVV